MGSSNAVSSSVDVGTPITRNYSTYPVETMKITQGYNDGNHADYVDYPFDEACKDTGRSWMYCPCDAMKVRRNYTAGVNTVWMESTSPVIMPCGTDYRGTITGNGWAQGTNNSWHITTSGNPIKAEQAFYRDPNFTTVIQNKGINLPLLP